MEYFTTKSPRIRIISLRNGGIATMRKRITIQVDVANKITLV